MDVPQSDDIRLAHPPGQQEFLPAAHAMVLGMVAAGSPLSAILDAITRLMETDLPGSRCSVLLASPDGLLHTAAAPSLPTAWLEALSGGVPIAPDEGSCGAAAWSRRPVIVEDVTQATSWRKYAEAATAAGLRACWSVPIMVEDVVVGTFAVYYDRPRRPSPDDIQHLSGYAQLTAVATSRTRAEEHLRTQLSHDPTTGLPGVHQLHDTVTAALGRLRDWEGGRVAVVAVHLRRLREINATFGYAVGDHILRATALAMQGVLAGRGKVLRVGGGRFVTVSDPLADDAQALQLARALLVELERPQPTGRPGEQVDLAPAAGLAVASRAEHDPNLLRQQADLAANDAPLGMVDNLVVFDERVVERAAADLALEVGLRRAVQHDELELHYQPIIDLDSGQVSALEALVRWEDPDSGLRSPVEFIPVAERTDLIRPLTRWVLMEACRQVARWRDARPERPVPVSVNLSAGHLHDPHLIDDVRAAVTGAGIAPALLWLEVTETAVMADAAAALEVLRGLKSLGVRLAIDDFGTGYSSLAYLKNLPVDTVKVDGAFVREMPTSPQDAALVNAVVGLADSLGLEVIAEGVETAAQRDALATTGCHLAQGFLWARPRLADIELIADTPPMASVVTASRPARPQSSVDVDDVLSVLVHELRTPLSVIRMTAQALTAAPEEVDLAAGAETVERQVGMVDALLATVSTARALDRGSVGLDPRQLDLSELVAAVVADHEPLLTSATVTVQAPAPVVALADPARVQQIVTNLVNNADKHSPPGGQVTLSVDTAGRYARIRVADRGPGIDPEQLATVFRKFGRVDRTLPGLGLGLYIARGLARAHSGELTAANNTSGGAEFTLLLPIREPAPA
jgi:diguanylate cyclase (GGDEF)-like protein